MTCRLSRSARPLHIEALVYCNRLALDGFVPAGALRRLTGARLLFSAGLRGRVLRGAAWESV